MTFSEANDTKLLISHTYWRNRYWNIIGDVFSTLQFVRDSITRDPMHARMLMCKKL